MIFLFTFTTWNWKLKKSSKWKSGIFYMRQKVTLTRSVAGFLSFQLIFTVNSAHKNYKLYLPYSKTTLHLQNNFFCIWSLRWVITPVTKPEKQNRNFVKPKYFEKPFTKNKNWDSIRPRIEYSKIWHQVNNRHMVFYQFVITIVRKFSWNFARVIFG